MTTEDSPTLTLEKQIVVEQYVEKLDLLLPWRDKAEKELVRILAKQLYKVVGVPTAQLFPEVFARVSSPSSLRIRHHRNYATRIGFISPPTSSLEWGIAGQGRHIKTTLFAKSPVYQHIVVYFEIAENEIEYEYLLLRQKK